MSRGEQDTLTKDARTRVLAFGPGAGVASGAGAVFSLLSGCKSSVDVELVYIA
jgi:hypothetical protein